MSWEEKYNELKIEHGNLTRKYNEAFQALRIKNDNQRDYEDLFTAFSEIQRKHRSVVEKYKAAHQTIAKLKRENQSQKRRLTGRALQTKNQKTSERGVPKAVLNDRGNVAENDNHNVEINHELMERLISAERQLKSLSVQEIARPISDAESDAAATLRQQLQETTVRLNLLKSQNEYAESKMKAQGEKLEQILLLHGEYRTKYTALKKELQFYRADNEALEAKASKIDDMKELITELTEQNSFLEGQVTKLCVPAQVNDEKQMLIATIHEKET
jgi:chromosome segregation ATPase